MYKDTPKNLRAYLTEVQMLKKLEHKGFISMVDSIEDVSICCSHDILQPPISCSIIVLPYMENGDLLQWISTKHTF